MVIDFHVHIQPRSSDDDVLRFLDELTAHRIDMAVVHPLGRTEQELKESTENIVRLAEKHPDRLIPFGSVFPNTRGAADTFRTQVTELGVKGLKLHPLLQRFDPSESYMTPLVEVCIELDVPILVHTGGGYMSDGRLWDADAVRLDELAGRHPKAKIVIAHGNPFGPDPYIAARHPNVYLDTTITFAKFARLVPNIGPEMLDWMHTDERLLYGSDAFPDHTHYLSYNLDPILAMNVSEETRAKVLGGNAAKLLKLA
jgi:predicted TIM-barrel fold metal-dependent hydrolase